MSLTTARPAAPRARRDLPRLSLSLILIIAAALAGELLLGVGFRRGAGEVALDAAFTVALGVAAWRVIWGAVARISLPIRAIEAAIKAFSSGAPAEAAEGLLPKEGPRGVEYIAEEIGDLMGRVRGWKEELEAEVARRTFELEFRNALLRSVSASEDDAGAYFAVAEAIRSFFSADRVLFAYYNGSRMLVSVEACASCPAPEPEAEAYGEKKGRPAPMSLAEAELLARGAEGEEIDARRLGFPSARPIAFSLAPQGDQVGYVAISRESPFTPGDRTVLGASFDAFAIQVHMRKESSRREFVRREAETALRRSEQRLRNFFEESKDMIYSSNADDVVASINHAGLLLLGIEDRFEVIGRPMANHLMAEEDRRFFLQKIRTQGFAADYECIFKRKDGTTIFCIESAYAMKDGEGRIIEIQGIVKDISDRIANERELWKSNLELAEANSKLRSTQMLMVQHEKLASIGQLAAGVAHEINNPLGFLKSNQGTLEGYLRAMRTGWEEAASAFPDKIAEISGRLDLDYIFQETEALIAESNDGYERIIDIVKNLKSFARIEAEPTMGPYDLNKGIESSLVVARNEYKYCAEIALDLGELPPIVAAGGEINQVILNVIVNAAQAIESQKRKEKGTIMITTRLEGDWVVLKIEDDGPGIPEDKRLKVFDPFYTTKEPGKGTGLGLSISYDIIVRKHGGTLTLHDSLLGGALFKATLPVEGVSAEGNAGGAG